MGNFCSPENISRVVSIFAGKSYEECKDCYETLPVRDVTILHRANGEEIRALNPILADFLDATLFRNWKWSN